jgi:HAMP domain-containing protein
MFAHFETAQRTATSVVAAVMFAAVLVAAAVPVIPVA